MAFSSLPSLPVSLYGAVWDHRSHRASPWKPSFGFSVGFPPFFPVVASRFSLLASGEGLGGGYCTPPNQKLGE